MAISAKEVQALRQSTGAGMMDAKRALEETTGDAEAAALWLRERGLGKAAERSDRENAEGAIALARNGNVAALVQLKCETDFVAKSPDFVNLVNDLAQAVVDKGESATADMSDAIDDLRLTLKENIELGQVVRFEVPEGHVLDTYLHVQNGRGVNGILIELDGGTVELAHDIALTAAFSRPGAVTRDEVDAALIENERAQLEKETLAEGKPEAAIPK
ncbi:MAG: elongation factor Ts, partial [Actinomycetota bacterium]